MRIIKPVQKQNANLSATESNGEPSHLELDGEYWVENTEPDAVLSGDLDKSLAALSGGDVSAGSGETEHTVKKEFNVLMAKAVRLLAMREHSVKEVTDKLRAKTEQPHLVDSVVNELIERNYLSDQRFSESYVRHRRNRGFGPVKIRAELLVKGISTALVDEYLHLNSSLWYETAQQQYDKKYGDAAVSDYNAWTKRARFLQSRGFTNEHIQVTVPRVDFD